MCDLFILAAEPSADLHGAKLVEELLHLRPTLKIAAVAGPRMRKLPIQTLFPMEDLQIMGFLDVIAALPRIARQFFAIRRAILQLNPKALVCIDYPGFNLRLERSLRKKKFAGKLIHYICPTVWAWGKKRISKMAETLDLLLALFPFEKACFASTTLRVEYVGHPLASRIPLFNEVRKEKILALFPGSREAEIRRNFPLQLAAAKKLSAKIAVSIAHRDHESLILSLAGSSDIEFYPTERNYELMRSAWVACATSGTVTLELALHAVPTVVNFAIRPIDCFIAQKIFRIDLPFYCIVNIILDKRVFPELFGPHFTIESLSFWIDKLWNDEAERAGIMDGCVKVRKALGSLDSSREAAQAVISTMVR